MTLGQASAKIIPSILVANEEEFVKNIRGLNDAVDLVQIDITDGKFVPNVTWADSEVIKKILPFDCELHLMVSEPLRELKKWAAVEQVKRILVHCEAVKNLTEIMPTLHAYGYEIGVVLNPDTPLEAIQPVAEEIDGVMLMGVHPGRQGQKFILETTDKIRECKRKFPNLFLEVDGGVNQDTIASIVAAGADAVCPGSAIFDNDGTPAENVKKMKDLIGSLTVQS